MKKTVYQRPEIRDENDSIIQEGTYGKNSPLVNADNTGAFDYINNNLEYLKETSATTTQDLRQEITTAQQDLRQEITTAIAEVVETKTLTVTGETSVPTANSDNNSKSIANTAFVQRAVAGVVNSAPETLDTLNELATALGNDPNFATTTANAIGRKLEKTDAETEFARIRSDMQLEREIIRQETEAAITAAITAAIRQTKEDLYPVGAVYISLTDSRNPAEILGFGTWTPLEGGTSLISAGTVTDEDGVERTYESGKTYGKNYSQISVDEIERVEGYVSSVLRWNNKQTQGGILSAENGANRFPSFASENTCNATIKIAFGGGGYHCNVGRSTSVYCWRRQQ